MAGHKRTVVNIKRRCAGQRALSPAIDRCDAAEQCRRAPSRGGQAHPRRPRQLRHPQTSQSIGLAVAPSALDFSLTPTSASWLNAVENFFSKMTRQRIRRGVFRSVADLQAAINAYLADDNTQPQAVRLDQIRRRHSRQTRPPPCTICLIQWATCHGRRSSGPRPVPGGSPAVSAEYYACGS
jgi:hypothetical protein